MTTGDKIKALRDMSLMSQEELGRKLLVGGRMIDLWESNKASPTTDELIRIKEVFGISADEFIGGGEYAVIPETPTESFSYSFTDDEAKKANDRFYRSYFTLPIVTLIVAAVGIITGILYLKDIPVPAAFLIGLETSFALYSLTRFISLNKLKNFSRSNLTGTEYSFRVFHDRIEIMYVRADNGFNRCIMFPKNIKAVRDFGDFVVVTAGNTFFLIKKSALPSGSFFLRRINGAK